MSTTAVLYVNRPHMQLHIHSHVLLCELDMSETFCTSLAIKAKQVYLYTTCQQDDLKCFTKTLNHQQQKNKHIMIKTIIKKCHLNVIKEKNRNILHWFCLGKPATRSR